MPIWLANYLMRRHRLDPNCAGLLAEFAGFGKGCQECGRYNELPYCTFCSSRLCKLHMKPCHFCLQFNDDIHNDSVCCSQCVCVWCGRGVCPDHKVTCKCGNNICYNQGCGACENCPAFCHSNSPMSVFSHGFFCRDYLDYLQTCPRCRPVLDPPQVCDLCLHEAQRFGSNCMDGIDACQICTRNVCAMCSRGCIECVKKICDDCIDSGRGIRCIRCSHWGVFCGKCRLSCYCAPKRHTKKYTPRKTKRKVNVKKKRKKISKKRSGKKIATKRKKVKKKTIK